MEQRVESFLIEGSGESMIFTLQSEATAAGTVMTEEGFALSTLLRGEEAPEVAHSGTSAAVVRLLTSVDCIVRLLFALNYLICVDSCRIYIFSSG